MSDQFLKGYEKKNKGPDPEFVNLESPISIRSGDLNNIIEIDLESG